MTITNKKTHGIFYTKNKTHAKSLVIKIPGGSGSELITSCVVFFFLFGLFLAVSLFKRNSDSVSSLMDHPYPVHSTAKCPRAILKAAGASLRFI